MKMIKKVMGLSLALGVAPLAWAEWIGENPAPKGEERESFLGAKLKAILPKNCPRFRKVFELPAGEIVEASVEAVGLGGYELWINGEKYDKDRVMSPAWSDPHNRVLSDTYDVRAKLRAGETNVIGAWVSSGYSDDYNAWGWRWVRPKALNLSVEIKYADGHKHRLSTDATWQWTSDQPIVSASIYHGETYDATKEDSGWATTRSVARWRPVKVCDGPIGRIEKNIGPAVHYCEPLAPQSITPLKDGAWLLDFGVNRAGVVSFAAKLTKGAKVVIQCADEIKNGQLDMSKCRGAAQRDTYIASGDGVESYRPRFTYHGFRYAQISGLDSEAVRSVRAWAVQADFRETASFRSSDATLNWFWQAALRTMRGNMLTYSSDCFTRGERTPCLMDSQAYEDTAMIAFDTKAYYEKWLNDATYYRHGKDPKFDNNGNPDWMGEPIALAARLVRKYGRLAAVEREYPRLREIAEDFARRATNGVWHSGFGDWCAPNEKGDYHTSFSSVAVVNSALLCYDLSEMAYLAETFGRDDDRQHFMAEYERCRAAFVEVFGRADGTFGEGNQVGCILPLAFGLVAGDKQAKTLEALLRRIREIDGGKIGTGIFGTRYLGDVLLDAGESDLWLKMLKGPQYPSFGFMKENGATTLWEQWTRDGGMASHSHAMFAGAAAALVSRLGGIRTVRHDASDFEIRPSYPTEIEWVEVTQDFARGKVKVSWRRVGNGIKTKISLPEGTTGRLILTGSIHRLIAGENAIMH